MKEPIFGLAMIALCFITFPLGFPQLTTLEQILVGIGMAAVAMLIARK